MRSDEGSEAVSVSGEGELEVLSREGGEVTVGLSRVFVCHFEGVRVEVDGEKRATRS